MADQNAEEPAPSTAAPPAGTKAGVEVEAAAAGKGGGAGSGPGGEVAENVPEGAGEESAEVDPKVSGAKKSMAGKASPYAMPEGGEIILFREIEGAMMRSCVCAFFVYDF